MKDSRIIVIHQENAGLSSARNAALDIARGEYIMFVDSDDWVEPTYCEKALSLVTTHKVYIVNFSFRKHESHFVIPQKVFSPRILNSSDTIKHILLGDEPSISTVVWNKIYKKHLFNNYRFPVGMIHEDNDAVYRLVHIAKKIYVSEEILYNYRVRTDSISSITNYHKPNHISDCFQLMYLRLCFIRKNYPELNESATIKLAWYVMYHIMHLNHTKDKNEQEIIKKLSIFLYDNKRLLLSMPGNRPFRYFFYSNFIFNTYVLLSKTKRRVLTTFPSHFFKDC